MQNKVQIVENNYVVRYSGMGRTRMIQFDIQYNLEKNQSISEPKLVIGSHNFPLKFIQREDKKWLVGNYSQIKEAGQYTEFSDEGVFESAPFEESFLQLLINNKVVEIPVGSFTKQEATNLIP